MQWPVNAPKNEMNHSHSPYIRNKSPPPLRKEILRARCISNESNRLKTTCERM